jgi:RNA polymerase sigma-70 factor (ECF subfamily)
VEEGYEPVDPRTGSRPDQAAEAREVFTVIAGLPDVFRDALVAIDVVGLTYGEAAELLGAKEATITSRLFRARAQVARGMESSLEGV